MTTNPDVEAANTAFYDAFRGRDHIGMASIWAQRAEVCCIHPGQEPLNVRPAIIDSWNEILSSPDSPQISAKSVQVFMRSPTFVIVVCEEDIGGDQPECLTATNAFALEDGPHAYGVWRICHHHAGRRN